MSTSICKIWNSEITLHNVPFYKKEVVSSYKAVVIESKLIKNFDYMSKPVEELISTGLLNLGYFTLKPPSFS